MDYSTDSPELEEDEQDEVEELSLEVSENQKERSQDQPNSDVALNGKYHYNYI